MPRPVILLIAFCCCLSFADAQVNFTSSNLPVIVINTNGQTIPDDPKITADMGIIYNGPGVRNNITDSFNEYNGKIGIEIRGQSSQMFPMKSYSVELRDTLGESVDKSLFGLPEESDWVLYAPYTDKTLMRNFLAYTLSNSLGHWAAHCRFVEVMLNGSYAGIYVFMEKIKRNSGRVDIKKLKSSDNSGDAVTGGYIFSIDKDADGWFSSYHPNDDPNANIQFSYVYPKIEDITTQQQAYIKSYVDSFENAL
ncbi:MAG TPA: CotH kinase family protein, partial [Chitinophagaceae bacterium]|nr:CotH kinase family protein [Chitinophagaceae bacterium]